MKQEPVFVRKCNWREIQDSAIASMIKEGTIKCIGGSLGVEPLYRVKFFLKLKMGAPNSKPDVRPVALSTSLRKQEVTREQKALLQFAEKKLFKFSVDPKGDQFGVVWAKFVKRLTTDSPVYIVIADIKVSLFMLPLFTTFMILQNWKTLIQRHLQLHIQHLILGRFRFS